MTTEQPPKKRRGPAKVGGATKRFSGKRSDDRKEAGRGSRPNGGPKAKFAPRKDRGDSKPAKFAKKGRRDVSDPPKRQSAARDDEAGFNLEKGERIAKVMARVGLCSRREAETWILAGRVDVNGKTLETPAVTVTDADDVKVDGEPLPLRERTRLWLYYKPRGLVTTNHDPEGRPTVFERLPKELPRVLTVGRLDINTEGLLLLTNDGGLARVLELPATGWLRRYRVRAFGKVTQEQLNTLADGVAIDGVLYGAIEVTLDKEQGDNVWLTVGLREGKNREVKRVLEHIGLAVNRLIRLSFGPFQLMDLQEGGVREIRGRVLRDQLGDKLAEEAGADFDAPIFNETKPEADKEARGGAAKSAAGGPKAAKGSWMTAREGKAAKTGRKPAGSTRRDDDGAKGDRGPRRNSDDRQDRGGRGGAERQQNRRRDAGETKVKVSPRSRFRMTSEPKPRMNRDGDERRPPRQRRIWGEEGLVDDKQQELRSSRDKAASRPGADRFRADRPKSDRPRTDRSGSDRTGSDRPSSDRPGSGKPRGPRRGDRS